jgi:serine-type D-Ala-D-Ala carboxypeptidase/endopeptidase
MTIFNCTRWTAFMAAAFLSAGCGGGSDDPPPPAPTPQGFSAIDAAVSSAYATRNVPLGLSIYDRHGVKVHEITFGGFSADQRVAIASASKLVSGVVLLRLVDQGLLTLDSTTAQVLGWSGANGSITLRQLLSFTSGLAPANLCTSNAAATLADCVETISQASTSAPPQALIQQGVDDELGRRRESSVLLARGFAGAVPAIAERGAANSERERVHCC